MAILKCLKCLREYNTGPSAQHTGGTRNPDNPAEITTIGKLRSPCCDAPVRRSTYSRHEINRMAGKGRFCDWGVERDRADRHKRRASGYTQLGDVWPTQPGRVATRKLTDKEADLIVRLCANAP